MAKYIKKLKNDAWSIINEQEKLAILNEIEIEAANKDGRKARSIVAEDLPGMRAKFDSGRDVTIISPVALSDAGLSFYAVYHEGRHAYQADVVNGTLKNDKTFTVWSKNWKGYLNPNAIGIEFFDYYLQPLELDANQTALAKLKKLSARLKDGRVNKSFLKLQKLLNDNIGDAKIEYGNNWQKGIQSKIDTALAAKNNQTLFPAVIEKLSKEGIRIDQFFFDYLTPDLIIERDSGVQQKQQIQELKQKEKALITKYEQETAELKKELAEKHGFSGRAAKTVTKTADEKTQKEKKPPAKREEAKESDIQKNTAKKAVGTNTTVKVTINRGKERSK